MVNITSVNMGVQDIPALYDTIRISDVVELKPYFAKWGMQIDNIDWNIAVVKNRLLHLVPVVTEFGETTMKKLPMGYKICVLAHVACKTNKQLCAMAGSLGSNAFYDLLEITKGYNNVTLYSPHHLFFWDLTNVPRSELNVSWWK